MCVNNNDNSNETEKSKVTHMEREERKGKLL